MLNFVFNFEKQKINLWKIHRKIETNLYLLIHIHIYLFLKSSDTLSLFIFLNCLFFVQVLTQEDWNTVLYNGMDKTSAWASLYFIALMTFGNYVLFNLLVAILVEGFSTEVTQNNENNFTIHFYLKDIIHYRNCISGFC